MLSCGGFTLAWADMMNTMGNNKIVESVPIDLIHGWRKV